MNIYVQSVSENAVAAMRRLEAACARRLPARARTERVM
jgi:hypothetical protein